MLAGFIIAPIILLGLIYIIFNFPIIESLLSYCLRILIIISEHGSKIPLNKIYLITPCFLSLLLYYITMFLGIFIMKIKLEKNPHLFYIRIKNIISLLKYRFNQNKNKVISSVLIISTILLSVYFIPKNLKIHFVDVGQRRLYSYCNP